jgi:Protein of unknown function (DUF2946)
MDDIVKQAMAKWPNVPDVYGWLSLSRRGEWRIKDDKISNPIVTDFINRNYTHDDQGRWFFQNGPQRVYVSLDYTPTVYRYADYLQIQTHTGKPVHYFELAFIDESGSVLLKTAEGIGLVDDRDLDKYLSLMVDQNGVTLSPGALEKLTQIEPVSWRGLFLNIGDKSLPLGNIVTAEVAQRFGFNPNPRQPIGEDECH